MTRERVPSCSKGYLLSFNDSALSCSTTVLRWQTTWANGHSSVYIFLTNVLFPRPRYRRCLGHLKQISIAQWCRRGWQCVRLRLKSAIDMKWSNIVLPEWHQTPGIISCLVSGVYLAYNQSDPASTAFWLHCALSLAAQCIVIGPVCGFVFVCFCVWGSVTTITRNCVHRSSPNWVFR